MAVQSDTSSISYTGNNSTVTSYAVPFVFLENGHLQAIAKVTATGAETAVTLTNHTGAGDPNGGTVRTAVAVPATSTLNIFRTVPATQTTQYQEGGDFPAASHERALDKLTFISQQNARAVQRSLRVTEGSGEKNEVVAVPNTLLGLDSNNQPKALTLSEVKSYLALTGTTLSVPAGSKTFADSGERALAVPDFSGQLGTQRDAAGIYIATGTSAGNWAFLAPMSGFRNAIINGNFDIWQRGTSFTASEYGADRWVNARIGSSSTMSRQAFTLGQTDVPNEPTYFCRMAVTSSAAVGNYALLQQSIEDARTFAGQTVTVSFYAKADSARPITTELVQFFGTGGTPSSAVQAIGTTKTTLSTSWQKITVTVSVPSISGKTLGSDNNHSLFLRIWLDAGSDFNTNTAFLGQQSGTFDIAQVQVEAGSVATPFERRPIGSELALCQRYFEKMTPVQIIATGNGFTNLLYKTNKRSIPTLTSTVAGFAVALSDTYSSVASATSDGAGDVTVSAEL